MQIILLPAGIVAAIGILAGIILTVADKFMSVPVNEQVLKVREILPGANCGACGFAGCDEYAENLVRQGVKINLCTPGGGDTAQRISRLLDIPFEEVERKRAIIKCAGTRDATSYIMDYQGPQTCADCNYFYRGRGSCSHSCLGYGDCVGVCQYGALKIVNGVALVDPVACTGCGMCALRCPNELIQIVPASSEVYVACSSTDTGGFIRKICKAGCIGCKRCERVCEFGAVIIENNLARINLEKCTNCGRCIGVCPTGVIRKSACADYMEIAR